jgi:BirA family biotin operon repressor/biotin-[acetyl-CoA-carboxylase] ligase
MKPNPNPMSRHCEVCGSTNDEARAWAADSREPAGDFASVTADLQTSGRGRQGRRWDADAGANVILSIVVRPPDGLLQAWAMGFAASVAIADALESVGCRPLLKWPNDVLLDGFKVAGILVEAAAQPAPAVVVGIGVNVNQVDFSSEETYAYPPTSVRRSVGREVDRAALAKAIVERFRHWEMVRRELGPKPILDAWRLRMAVGAEVTAGSTKGRLQDVLDDGRALVALGDGTLARWTSVDSA